MIYEDYQHIKAGSCTNKKTTVSTAAQLFVSDFPPEREWKETDWKWEMAF